MGTASRCLPLVLLLGCRPGSAEAAFQIAGEQAVVYTTAESTSLRLTPTNTLTFKPSEPTSEAKLYVFVDPRKTFQPFIGIGGGLTAAPAETFAKLPPPRQERVLGADFGTPPGDGGPPARAKH